MSPQPEPWCFKANERAVPSGTTRLGDVRGLYSRIFRGHFFKNCPTTYPSRAAEFAPRREDAITDSIQPRTQIVQSCAPN